MILGIRVTLVSGSVWLTDILEEKNGAIHTQNFQKRQQEYYRLVIITRLNLQCGYRDKTVKSSRYEQLPKSNDSFLWDLYLKMDIFSVFAWYFEKMVFNYLSVDRSYVGIWFGLNSGVIIWEAVTLSN